MYLEISEECYSYLAEAEFFLNKIEEVDAYRTIFEEQSDDVADIEARNDNAKEGAKSSIIKALESLKELISTGIKHIVGFIQKIFASKEERQKYEMLKREFSNNPALKNKKFTFYDYKHNMDKWMSVEAQAEEADKKLSRGIDVDINPIINLASQYSKEFKFVGGAASEAIGLQVLNQCYGSKEFADKMNQFFSNDLVITAQIEKLMGEKSAKKLRKEIKSLSSAGDLKLFGKRINLKRAMNKNRIAACDNMENTFKYTIGQLENTVKQARNGVTELTNDGRNKLVNRLNSVASLRKAANTEYGRGVVRSLKHSGLLK